MTNLSKLDETVDQLEKQAEILKQHNKVLSKISELSNVIEKGVNELSLGNQHFNKTQKDIQNSLNSLYDLVNNLEKSNGKHIDVLVSSNKKLLRELEDTVSSKLERFSSDIQVTIRQERSQLQESLQNNISSQFNSLESKQKELFQLHAKQISMLKILLIVVIIISAGMGAAILLK